MSCFFEGIKISGHPLLKMERFLLIFWLFLYSGILCPSAASNLFVSIDCGTTGTYSDSLGITWVGDASYVKSGETARTRTGSSVAQHLATLRYFTSRRKNCYVIPGVTKGSKYLVRASFNYGNYDTKASPPTFGLQFDGNHWDRVVTSLQKEVIYEVIYAAKGKSIPVCLAQTLPGQIPFISSLEVRSVTNMYKTDSSEDALFTLAAINFGSSAIVRYPDDPYDRIWHPNPPISGLMSVTSDSTVMDPSVEDNPPNVVMLQAVTPSLKTARSMTIPNPIQSTSPLDIYFNVYYAEVSRLVDATKGRCFDFKIDGQQDYGPIIPPYQRAKEHYRPNISLSANTVFSWENEANATMPPLVNAMEFFIIRSVNSFVTSTTDVNGLTVLQDRYEQLSTWGGDPCLPAGFAWDWLNCSDDESPRVTALYLNGLGLTGSLPDFRALASLETIDLSNNSLSGQIPYFLGLFPYLKELNLANNDFSGPLPSSLRNNKYLNLNVSENRVDPGIEPSDGATNNKGPRKKLPVIVGASVGSALLLLLLLGGILFICSRRKPNDEGNNNNSRDDHQFQNNRTFSYAQILEITNNFEKLIGKGGSSMVYHGCLENGDQVAVKVLADMLPHSRLKFVAEVKLLMTVHHKNLVSFIGFCEEGNKMILLYEYMHNGNIGEILSGNKTILECLTWKKRLEIAVDVASGLHYLHAGCQPPIIHRDVKTANILLNQQLEAKLADFGVSKAGPVGEVTHVSTVIVGTPGYIDPEYSETNMLTKKSDVYSFGVIQFELISGRPAIFRASEGNVHIVQWAASKISRNDMASIIDSRIQGLNNINSMWKVIEIAIACTSQSPKKRPDMDFVLTQLREALELENGYPMSMPASVSSSEISLSHMEHLQIPSLR